ncbi:MAG: hypothetical protein H6581_19480 [Bacteroidia bacterium]|nr:hypothetical protein [Bacteroidia bacterium]
MRVWKLLFGLGMVFWLNACEKPVTVEGGWEFESTVGMNTVKGPDARFFFHPGGKFEQESIGRTRTGTWEEKKDENGHFVFIHSDEGGESSFKILDLTPEKMTYEEQGPIKRTYSWKRLSTENKPPRRTAKKVL